MILSWLRLRRIKPVCVCTMCDRGALAGSITLPEVGWPLVVTNTSVSSGRLGNSLTFLYIYNETYFSDDQFSYIVRVLTWRA